MLSMACSPDMTLFLPDSQNSGWTASPSLPLLPSIMTPWIFLEQLKCISALGFYIHREFSLKGFSLTYFLSLKFLPKCFFHITGPCFPTQIPSFFGPESSFLSYYAVSFYSTEKMSELQSMWNYSNYLLSFSSRQNKSSVEAVSFFCCTEVRTLASYKRQGQSTGS